MSGETIAFYNKGLSSKIEESRPELSSPILFVLPFTLFRAARKRAGKRLSSGNGPNITGIAARSSFLEVS